MSESTEAGSARARDGFAHLQAAAREMIDAARAMLDAAEELIDDPNAVAQMVGVISSVAKAAGSIVIGPDRSDDNEGTTDGSEGVERIDVG